MASNGFQLIKNNRWCFYFERATQRKTDYHMYIAVEKNDKHRKDFFDLKRKYAQSKTKSDFNKNDTSLRIFETDPNKIDDSYYAAKQFRKQVYIIHYVKLVIAFFVLFIGFCCLLPYVGDVTFLAICIIFSILFLIYYLVCVLLLVWQKNQSGDTDQSGDG